MTRSPRKSALTNSPNPQFERQARRISRQQKQLNKELLNEMGQNSPPRLVGATGRSITIKNLTHIDPLTDMQANFFDAYEDGVEAHVLYGSAGTGKTFLAVYHALQDILTPESIYKRIVIIRSSVQAREQGHLPGTIEEKMEPFERPYIDICADLLGRKDAYEKLKESGKIEFMSSSLLRGATFSDSIIIADEIQNFSIQEISTVATRVGQNAKIIFCGDSRQDDLHYHKNDQSGFRDFLAVAKNMVEFRTFQFTTDDICRSGFVKAWIIQCERLGI